MLKREENIMRATDVRVEHNLGSITKSGIKQDTDIFEIRINGLDKKGRDNSLYLELFISKSELKNMGAGKEYNLKKYMYDCLYSVNGSDVEFLIDDVKEASLKKLNSGDIKILVKTTEPNIVAEATLDKSYYLN